MEYQNKITEYLKTKSGEFISLKKVYSIVKKRKLDFLIAVDRLIENGIIEINSASDSIRIA